MASCLVNTADVAPVTTGPIGPGRTAPRVSSGERPAGAVIPNHRHRSDRTEYIVFSTEPGINYL